MNFLRIYNDEVFKTYIFNIIESKKMYAFSNKGRIVSYESDLKFGIEINGSKKDGYRCIQFARIINGKKKYFNFFVYKIIAELFLEKPTENHCHVVHLDRNRANDKVNNLKWMTNEEWKAFHKASPYVIQNKKNLSARNKDRRYKDGSKLTSTEVIRIKMMMKRNPNMRLKMIAKQFGVSNMQISRIKKGENWNHIQI